MKQSQQLAQIKFHIQKFSQIDKKLSLMRAELNQMPLGSYPEFADRMENLLDQKDKIAFATMHMLVAYFGE